MPSIAMSSSADALTDASASSSISRGWANILAPRPLSCAKPTAACARCVLPTPGPPQISIPVSLPPVTNANKVSTNSALRPARKLAKLGGAGTASSKTSCSTNDASAIQRGLVILRPQVTQAYQQRRAHRQRQQDAGESAEFAEGEQREDNHQRMQPDAIADQPRNKHIAFQQLADAVHREHRGETRPAVPLQQCSQYAKDEPKPETDVGNEYQEASEYADGQRELQSGQRQSHCVIDRQHAHHRQLAAKKFSQNVVDLGCHRAHFGEPAPRRELVQAPHYPTPV